MNPLQKFAVIIIVASSFISYQPSAWAVCDFATLADGAVIVGTAPYTRRLITVIPEVATIQEAVDLAKDCEFQISGFTVPSGATVTVTTGSNTIANDQPATALWTSASDPIEWGDLIQIGGTGKWYEVESVTDTSITLTRDIEQASGSYSYAVSITPWIQIMRGTYLEGIALRGLHYVFISKHPDVPGDLAIIGSVQDFPGSPYGHLSFSQLTVRGQSATISLGNAEEHDTDVTVEYCKLVATGVDSFSSTYRGNYVFRHSWIQSSNDVAFVGLGSGPPVRSLFVEGSSFISAGTTIGGSQSIDIGGRKLLMLHVASGSGQHVIKDSYFSGISANGNSWGIVFGSFESAVLNIENTKFSCNACGLGPNPAPDGWLGGVVSAYRTATINVNNSEFAVSPDSCAATANQGSTVNVTNPQWPYDINGNPFVCAVNGGQVIY